MPELPEVETVMKGLEKTIKGQIISNVLINRPNLRWPFPNRMKVRLEGKLISNITRRSKYILIDLSSNETMIMHLGMSGRVLIQDSGKTLGHSTFHLDQGNLDKHDHVIFTLENGTIVIYNDPRRFGFIDLCKSDEIQNHKMIKILGVEPLSNQFSAIYLAEMFKNSRATIKSSLLNQKYVCGLGNIYVCEALWRSGIVPTRLAGTISLKKLEKLVNAIRVTLFEAIKAGGSSLKDFKNIEGNLGYFQHQFNVYDSEGKDCNTQGCKAKIKKIRLAGRSTFYCDKCQR